MANSKVKSAKTIGEENSERLRTWISETALDSIPINQFGYASRQRICALLGITRSTVDSNSTISALFHQLDASVLAHYSDTGRVPATTRPATAAGDYADLEARYIALKKQTAEVEAKLQRLRYLEDTGMLLGD
ncbi:hypothetical protein M3795_02655 [Ralstonia pickettii]|jgi:hypothetical protein|uniref:Uncharacterized protein n=1 Tax=Ralstonia pickettii OR214 TaxID=1264675 RepID=R0E6G9_RALPI|nr:hypothetical protein [Ralstonia pickettii]ENZ77684.1 hypothetical protein OR214_02688 [Ralstonia pickettii OR214]MCM3579393.1 hypothetical protein [Ralstonia pickettii]OYU21748.1 MAG: hypothetical protein CFE42_15665 [Ralstonia sp. PBBBR1]